MIAGTLKNTPKFQPIEIHGHSPCATRVFTKHDNTRQWVSFKGILFVVLRENQAESIVSPHGPAVRSIRSLTNSKTLLKLLQIATLYIEAEENYLTAGRRTNSLRNYLSHVGQKCSVTSTKLQAARIQINRAK